MGVVDTVGWSIYTLCPSHSKWLSESSNESASNFALSLNIPLWKLFGRFWRPQLWAPGDWQLHYDSAPARASRLVQSILGKHPGDSALLQPRFRALWLLAFTKTKITFEREEISDLDEIQKNIMGQLIATGRTMWGPKVPTLKGLRHHCPMTIFLVSCIFFNKCLYFSYYMAGYLLDSPRISGSRDEDMDILRFDPPLWQRRMGTRTTGCHKISTYYKILGPTNFTHYDPHFHLTLNSLCRNAILGSWGILT